MISTAVPLECMITGRDVFSAAESISSKVFFCRFRSSSVFTYWKSKPTSPIATIFPLVSLCFRIRLTVSSVSLGCSFFMFHGCIPMAAYTRLGCFCASCRLERLVSRFIELDTMAMMFDCFASSMRLSVFPWYAGSERWMWASTYFICFRLILCW